MSKQALGAVAVETATSAIREASLTDNAALREQSSGAMERIDDGLGLISERRPTV